MGAYTVQYGLHYQKDVTSYLKLMQEQSLCIKNTFFKVQFTLLYLFIFKIDLWKHWFTKYIFIFSQERNGKQGDQHNQVQFCALNAIFKHICATYVVIMGRTVHAPYDAQLSCVIKTAKSFCKWKERGVNKLY